MAGVLFVVSLPIGHLGDMTHRAIETLRSADAIIAEDTRTTRRVLHQYRIKTPFYTSLYQGSEERRLERILESLEDGRNLALVSDAGTPLISDPGFLLVRAAVQAGIRIIPIPGPTALVTALVASGLPADRFVFEGSVPRTASGRRALFDRLSKEARTAILYESPHRILDTLKYIADRCPDRRMAVGRELTKVHEEFLRGTPSEILADLEDRDAVRGEFVLVLDGATEPPIEQEPPAARRAAERLLAEGITRRTVVDLVQSIFDVARNDAYRLVHEAVPPNESPGD